jgi:alpha,alpha-trehalase
MAQLWHEVETAFRNLRPQVIRPAEGFLRYDYPVPGGYYKQMWDWDGFFIGTHLAMRGREGSRCLRWWALNLLNAADAEGYVPGCVTTQGPRPLFGKFALKPFLAQGCLLASQIGGDFEWLRSEFSSLLRVNAYRERTQQDGVSGLFFWDNAMHSGADNNPALTNDPDDREAHLACDVNGWQLREYAALALIADKLGRAEDGERLRIAARALARTMRERLWFPEEQSWFNVRRDTGEAMRRVSYSNFVPLLQRLNTADDGEAMLRRYLWNPDHLLSPHGLRTLSKSDPEYNNVCMIVPYSNWQGPVWPIANFIYSQAMLNYGLCAEAGALAETLARLVLKDIAECGSMHENYDAETGAPLAPTAEQSPGGMFEGFIGWNLLIQNMLEQAQTGAPTLPPLDFEVYSASG